MSYYDDDFTSRWEGPTRLSGSSPNTIDLIRSSANRQLVNAERTAARAQAQLDRLDNLPAKPKVKNFDTLVMVFDVKASSGKTFRYAAVHANQGWYLTGQQTGRFTWKQLIAFLVGVGRIDSAVIADSFVEA